MNFLTFFKEVHIEVKRVNWPTRDQVVRNTLLVLGISVAVAAFLGFLDYLFVTLLDRFIL